jgi:hypothetical protein
MASGQLTFVTVVFEAEFPLLELQARSMGRFVPPDLVESAIVVDNSAKGMPSSTRARLLEEYGAVGPKVRIIPADQVAKMPGTTGWRSQQVLKLSIADLVDNPTYVVLDAKNHFVTEPSVDYFVSADGRGRVNTHSYETHILRPILERVLTFVGVDPAPHIGSFTETATPFVLDKAIVQALTRDLEAKSGLPFPETFLRHDLAEFFLYSGWILSTGRSWDDVFAIGRDDCPIVWPRGASARTVNEAVVAARDRDTPLFAAHRRALMRLDAPGIYALANFWASVGLFDSGEDAAAFIEHFQVTCARLDRRARAREFPFRVRNVIWRELSKRTLPSRTGTG